MYKILSITNLDTKPTTIKDCCTGLSLWLITQINQGRKIPRNEKELLLGPEERKEITTLQEKYKTNHARMIQETDENNRSFKHYFTPVIKILKTLGYTTSQKELTLVFLDLHTTKHSLLIHSTNNDSTIYNLEGDTASIYKLKKTPNKNPTTHSDPDSLNKELQKLLYMPSITPPKVKGMIFSTLKKSITST